MSAAAVHPALRRCLGVLVAAQILGGAGLAAGITAGALLTQDMLGSSSPVVLGCRLRS